MTDTLVPGLVPAQSPELGDTIFEAPGELGVVDEENLITLNLGPQHPSTHGVFRLIMQLQGETVISAMPVMGYLHRSTEKLGEARTYVQGTVLTDRMDYLSPMTTNWAYALAIEKLDRPRGARARRVPARDHWRAVAHPVAPGRHGHVRHGRRHLAHRCSMPPRTREDARPAGAADWRAHEPALHPLRRRGARCAGRVLLAAREVHAHVSVARSTSTRRSWQERDVHGPHERHRA